MATGSKSWIQHYVPGPLHDSNCIPPKQMPLLWGVCEATFDPCLSEWYFSFNLFEIPSASFVGEDHCHRFRHQPPLPPSSLPVLLRRPTRSRQSLWAASSHAFPEETWHGAGYREAAELWVGVSLTLWPCFCLLGRGPCGSSCPYALQITVTNISEGSIPCDSLRLTSSWKKRFYSSWNWTEALSCLRECPLNRVSSSACRWPQASSLSWCSAH